MHNSKFLQFVSKLSRGELMFEDNKVSEPSRVEGSRRANNNPPFVSALKPWPGHLASWRVR